MEPVQTIKQSEIEQQYSKKPIVRKNSFEELLQSVENKQKNGQQQDLTTIKNQMGMSVTANIPTKNNLDLENTKRDHNQQDKKQMGDSQFQLKQSSSHFLKESEQKPKYNNGLQTINENLNQSSKLDQSSNEKVYLKKPVRTMTKQIIFVRHGQTEESQKSIVLGQQGGTLTKRGLDEAKKVGKFISKAKIDVAFISDLSRVKQAFEEIQGQMIQKIQNVKEEPLLRDIQLGKYQGTCIKDQKTYKTLKEMNLNRSKRAEPGAESWNDLEGRGIKFWQHLMENYLKRDDVRSILVVSHKGYLTTLLENAYLSEIDVGDNIKFFNFPMNHGEMIVMKTDYLNGQLRMIDFQRKQAA